MHITKPTEQNKSRTSLKKNSLALLCSALFLCLLILASCAPKQKKASVPSRIVCLSPSGAEIVCAIGAFSSIAARTSFCTYPEEMSTVPSVGGFDGKSLSVEKIMSFKPDFVYGADGMHNAIARQLELLGVTVYLGNGADGIDETLAEIEYISALLEKDSEGKKIIQHIQEQIQSVPKSVPIQSVYYEVWSEPFITAGKNSLIHDLLEAAGYKNSFGTLNESYPMVSEESILARQPDIIIVPDMNGTSIASIKSRNGWEQIPAVKNSRIFFIDADLVSRPGPRIADAVAALSNLENSRVYLPEK